jgi:hypothetical protein
LYDLVIFFLERPVRLAYQPPANCTFLSEQTSHQQPASNTFFSEQIITSHQPPAKRRNWKDGFLHCTTSAFRSRVLDTG